MNALPLDTSQTPREVIDDLVASFGLRRVLLAVLTRVFRRSRPPDAPSFPNLHWQPDVDNLSAHLRQDLGLPPETNTFLVDHITLRPGGLL
ncbi:hypothetical protein [Yoonia sp. BS5-3]|uniref:Uncharacterized protein n=1 Tax=Yoonia phaeophyticola TaxID=3137369 RepID=A0ABZ2V9W4_9RHOB